jgi:hypothetical protein
MKANAEKSIAEGGSKTITDFMLGQLESLQNTEELEVSFTDKGQWNVSYLDGVTFSLLDGFAKTKNTMPIETFGVIGRVNYSGFDVDATAAAIEKKVGGYLKQAGRSTISDPTKRKDYEDNMNAHLNQALGNAGQLASYLLDTIDVDENGEPFELTLDPSVAATSENYILVTINNNDSVPTFQVSDKAKEYAKQKLKQQVEGRFDISIRRSTSPKSPGGDGSGNTYAKQDNVDIRKKTNQLKKNLLDKQKIYDQFPNYDGLETDGMTKKDIVERLSLIGALEKQGVFKDTRADGIIIDLNTSEINYTPPSGSSSGSSSGTGSKYKIEGKP